MLTFIRRTGFLLALAAIGCLSGDVLPMPHAQIGPSSALLPRRPLVFEANRGQTSPEVDFLVRSSDFTMALSGGTEWFRFNSAPGTARDARQAGNLRLQLLDAVRPRAEGREQRQGVVNCLLGTDAERWVTGIPTYSRVDYPAIYPGIDLTYYFNASGTMERDFVVQPGADPSQIRYRLGAHQRPRIDGSGGLELATGALHVRQDPPIAYQDVEGERRPVQVAYTLSTSSTELDAVELAFDLGRYDRGRKLIIDPVRPRVVSKDPQAITPPAVIVYKTYTGTTTSAPAQPRQNNVADSSVADDPLPGSTTDLTIADNGDVLACGATNSPEFPATPGAEQTKFGGGTQDAWVARVSADGTEFRFCTYFGGIGEDRAFGVRLDDDGNPCVTGFTNSDDLPTKLPFQDKLAGGKDAFVAVLDPDGSGIRFATYMGGSGDDFATGLARDEDGMLFVTGRTSSVSSSVDRFPSTPGAFQHELGGIEDGFLTKIDPAARKIVFSTFFGGADVDRSNAVTCGEDGSVSIAGQTLSSDLPILDASQSARGGGLDAFAARFNGAGTALHFATYLGGSSTDAANELSLDPDGVVYVIGETQSADFPSGRGALDLTAKKRDGFLARMPAGGLTHNAILLSGKEDDIGFAVHAPDPNVAYVTGTTTSSDFIGSTASARKKHDFFVSEVEFAGETIAPELLGSFVESGDAEDGAYSITTRDFAKGRRVYLAGKTSSSDLTLKSLDPNRSPGDTGQFLMAFDDRYIQLKSSTLKFKATKVRRARKARIKIFNRLTGKDTATPIVVGSLSSPFAVVSGGGAAVIGPDGSHTIVVQFKPSSPGAATAFLKIDVKDPFPRTLSVEVKGKGKR